MSIFTENFTSRYPKRIINVHPSLIPSFCGKGYYGIHVHEAALQYGVKVTGATVHFVNEIPDGGEIIMQKSVPVRNRIRRKSFKSASWKRPSGSFCPGLSNRYPKIFRYREVDKNGRL
jgi:phosphoribosylglycinamide formyltransferase-1